MNKTCSDRWKFNLARCFLISYLLLADLLLLSHECDQVFSGQNYFLGLAAVWRRLRRVRVLLALVLTDALLPPLCPPLPAAPTLLLFPAGSTAKVDTQPLRDDRGSGCDFSCRQTDSVMVSRCLDVSIWISMLLFSSSIRLLLIAICWRKASRSCSLS